jgi:hypothetical protein
MAAGDSSKRSRPAVLATARSLMLDSIDNLAYGALWIAGDSRRRQNSHPWEYQLGSPGISALKQFGRV